MSEPLFVSTCEDCPFQRNGSGCLHPAASGQYHPVHSEIDDYYYRRKLSPPSCPLTDAPLKIIKTEGCS